LQFSAAAATTEEELTHSSWFGRCCCSGIAAAAEIVIKLCCRIRTGINVPAFLLRQFEGILENYEDLFKDALSLITSVSKNGI
jgi:hypothetical protein